LSLEANRLSQTHYTRHLILPIWNKTELSAIRNWTAVDRADRTDEPVVIKLVLIYEPKPAVPAGSKGPAIEKVTQGHLSDGSLEEYSLDRLPESSLATAEEHLLVCDQCRARLQGIEPINYIHHTEDGPVYERATRLTTGKLMARHWGQDLHAGRAFGNFSAAKQYLSESFSQMFPKHTCNGLCGSPQIRLDKPDSQDYPIQEDAEIRAKFTGMPDEHLGGAEDSTGFVPGPSEPS
jgi:hypothetical protein